MDSLCAKGSISIAYYETYKNSSHNRELFYQVFTELFETLFNLQTRLFPSFLKNRFLKSKGQVEINFIFSSKFRESILSQFQVKYIDTNSLNLFAKVSLLSNCFFTQVHLKI